MQWRARSLAFGATFTGLCTVAGLAGGVPPALADLGAQLTFLCAAPSGTHKVQASVIAPAPLSGTAGEPIRLGKITLGLAVPVAMLSDGSGGRPYRMPITTAPGEEGLGISGATRLAVTVTQNGRSTDAGWSDFTFETASVPEAEEGRVNLGGTATTPPLLPSGSGDLVWTVRGLSLALNDENGKGPRQVTCAPEGDGVLGRITVAESDTPSPGTRNVPRATPAAGGSADLETLCEIIPGPDGKKYGFNQDSRLKLWAEDGELGGEYPSYVRGFGGDPDDYRKTNLPGQPYCIRASGFSTVRKLGASTPVAAETLLRRGVEVFQPLGATTPSKNYYTQRGYMVAKAVPSTAATLSFGFMPTTSTTSIRQVAPPGSGPDGRVVGNFRIDIRWRGAMPPPEWAEKQYAWSRSFVDVKLDGAQVNGVPLNLGDDCKTAPTVLQLESDLGDVRRGGILFSEGATYIAEVDIPNFTGCGMGEDLSPLFNAAVSGPGNRVKIETGAWCGVPEDPGPEFCDSEREPEPETYTIKPGGKWVLKANQFTIPGRLGSSIYCDSLTMEFDLPKQHWVSRAHVTSTSAIDFSGCELRTTSATVGVEITNLNRITLSIEGYDSRTAGNVVLRLAGFELDVNAVWNGKKCSLRIADESLYFDRGRKYANQPIDLVVSLPNGGGPATVPRVNFKVQDVEDVTMCTGVPGFSPHTMLGTQVNFDVDPTQTFVRSW